MRFKVDTFDESNDLCIKKMEQFIKNIKKSFVLLAGELNLRPEIEDLYKQKIIEEKVDGTIITHRLKSSVIRELAKRYENLKLFYLPYREATHFSVADNENVWVENHPASTAGSGEIYYNAPEIGKQYLDLFGKFIKNGEAIYVLIEKIDSVFPLNPIRKEVKTEISRKFEENYPGIIKAL